MAFVERKTDRVAEHVCVEWDADVAELSMCLGKVDSSIASDEKGR